MAATKIGGYRPLRVLHLASFAGNIGDLANHAGARSLFRDRLDFQLEYTELEIREFYWKQRAFDAAFIDWANSFDLLMIGGGNYFELWVENSSTGTSIDLSPELLARLRVPTVYYSLGVDLGQGYADASARKFERFLQTALESNKAFVCVRNDGSSSALRQVLGSGYADAIPVMPDGGFFAARTFGTIERAQPDARIIGINLAGDMLDVRFDSDIDGNDFLSEFATLCTTLLDADADTSITLIPHIWRDVSVIASLLPLVPDPFLRRRISVHGLTPTESGLASFLSCYGNSSLILGMRFHANVCPIGMNVPTRGLVNYPQVRLLYEELGLEDRAHSVKQRGFSTAIIEGALADLADTASVRARYRAENDRLTAQANETLAGMNAWLSSRFN